jgi:hypothetical protein
MSSFKYLKLTSGEDVFGQIENKDGIYEIKNPVRMVLGPNGNAGMMDFCPFIKDKTIKLEEKHVMFEGEPETEIYNIYNQQFGSGIVLGSTIPEMKIR